MQDLEMYGGEEQAWIGGIGALSRLGQDSGCLYWRCSTSHERRGDELWEEFVSYISSICSVFFIFVPMFFYLQDDSTLPLDLGESPQRFVPLNLPRYALYNPYIVGTN